MSRPPMYSRPMRRTWFLERRAYVTYILRELTSVFIALYLVLLLTWLGRGFARGEEAFAAHLAALAHPWWRVLHAVVLAAAVFHAVTWFNLTPKAAPLQVGDRRVDERIVALVMGYLPWLVLTGAVLWAVWV